MKQKLSFEPRWLAVIIFFLVGIFLGALVFFIWIFNGGTLYGIQKVHPANSNYKFINPLLAITVNSPLQFFGNDTLKNKISSLISKSETDSQLNTASFYFQELESGRWFGVNEENKFSPGKFLKVPIMIAYYKAAESDSSLLKKILVYQTQPSDKNSSNQVDLQDGQSYTVEEFIQDMIIDDSDSSAIILFDNIDKSYLNEVYSDLGIDYHEDRTTDDFLTTKLNSLFYRILYNSTYLNRDDSEKALNTISQSDQGVGLDKSLPNDLVIAHRNRNRPVTINGQSFIETNDCGIVYYPNHPYILCGMVTAKSQTVINTFLTQISQVIYQDMSERYKNNN